MAGAAATQGATPEQTAQRNPSRRRVLIVIGIVALIAALVYGARWWTVGRFIESTDDAYLKAEA